MELYYNSLLLDTSSLNITMVILISVLLSALLICAVVQGDPLSKSGVEQKTSVERDDHILQSSTYNMDRRLLPHPPHEHDHPHPHPPHPPSHHHEQGSKYTGCLGLSDEELASFPDAPPCTISVNGIVVAGHDGSTAESGSSTSSGSVTSGSGSDGSGESNISSSGNNNDSSTSDFDYSKGDGVEGEDDRESGLDGSSGGYYSYELDGSNEGGGDSDETNISEIGIASNETKSSSGSGGDDSNETTATDASNGTSSVGTEEDSSNGADDDDVPSPLVYFNISDCGTYANMWVWDLAMTCSDSLMNQTDCKCTSAEILMQYGELYCPSTEDPVCPDNCSVCYTCMELLGCSSPDDVQDGQYLPPEKVLLGDGMSSTILPLALGIAAAILGLVGSSYYQYTHRNIDTGAFPSLELEPPSNASML